MRRKNVRTDNLSAVVFRFHDHFETCEARIRYLRYANVGMPIYGLFGGPVESFQRARALIGSDLDGIYRVDSEGKGSDTDPKVWNFLHGDLALRAWFGDFGQHQQFDRVYLIQWDEIYFVSLECAYAHVPRDTVGLTGYVRLSDIPHWWWTRKEPYRSQWLGLQALLKQRYGETGEPMACLGPGACFPRDFLEAYAETDVPELCHDEVRLPAFARALGFPVANTGFVHTWFDRSEVPFFNCDGIEIEAETIAAELRKKNGRRIFHPYRRPELPDLIWSFQR